MADSDNSRTLSRVTRGDLHSFVAASFPTNPERAARLDRPVDIQNDDLALVIRHQWCSAQGTSAPLGRGGNTSAFTNRCDCRIRAGHRES